MRWPNESRFNAEIDAAAARYGVPVPLVKAIISLESEFVPGAFRNEAARPSLPPTPDFPAGGDRSIGLMQLLVRTARILGYTGPIGDRSTLTGLYEPAENIRLGTMLLRDNVGEAARRGLDITAAISAYNGGWRPSLGFGKRLPNGQYANQAYVNVVSDRLRYFGGAALLPAAGSSSSSSSATAPYVVPLSVPIPDAPPVASPIGAGGELLAPQVNLGTLPAEPITDGGGTMPALLILAATLAVAYAATTVLGGDGER